MPVLRINHNLHKNIHHKAADIALYSFRIGDKRYMNKPLPDAFRILSNYKNSLNSNLSAYITWHQALSNIKKGSHGLVATSDFFVGAKLPPVTMCDPIKYQLLQAGKLIQAQTNFKGALGTLQNADIDLFKLHEKLSEYADKNQAGYESAIKALEFTRDTAETIIGAYNPYIGALYKGTVDLYQQTSEVYFNMRDKIDFVTIGADVIIGELFSLASEKIGDTIFNKLNTQTLLGNMNVEVQRKFYELMNRFPQKAKEKIIKMVVSKFADTLRATIVAEIRTYRNSPKIMTWQVVTDTVADNFTSKVYLQDFLSALLEELF